MPFVSGIHVIYAPASALNNAGKNPNSDNENAVATKALFVGRAPNRQRLPYVAPQAYRYWLRRTLESLGSEAWPTSPVFREKKVAYTDGDPIRYCDDDLFGYMRAEGKSTEAVESRSGRVSATPLEKKGKDKYVTITRVGPLHVGPLVALAEGIVSDFGTMSRHSGEPVPHEHEFYRASLKGMVSLDLGGVGTFTYEDRTGFLNLDSVRREKAEQEKLERLPEGKAYRLPLPERTRRAASVLRAMAVVTGGAKTSLHYTDVTPAVVVLVVTRGGNNPLQYAVRPDRDGQAEPDLDALIEAGEVWGDTLLSPLYVGWVRGYADEGRKKLDAGMDRLRAAFEHGVEVGHPRKVLEQLASDLEKNPDWMR